ncbi:MAG: hypothetical protein ACHQK8_03875 [Bacteroidia bacterium]
MRNFFIGCLFCSVALLFVSHKSVAQTDDEVQWQVLSPLPNIPINAGEYLFISVVVNDKFTFNAEDVKIYLDGQLLTATVRATGNRMSAITPTALLSGNHKIEIWTRFLGTEIFKYHGWYVTVVSSPGDEAAKNKSIFKDVTFAGRIDMDNKQEFLSGSDAALALRQEPLFTRTINVNVDAKYKDLTIPIRYFGTSDNDNSAPQSRNYFQSGFKYKGLEVLVGDVNPNFDKLILTGVRVNGFKASIRWGNSAIMFTSGDLNKAKEGSLSKWNGVGIPPANMNTSDSTYIGVNGTFRRSVNAVRFEFGQKKDYFKIGFTGMKATDDTTSIRYGVNPAQNVVGGTDIYINFFKKRLNINAGAAISIITNDISKRINKDSVEKTFGAMPFDPNAFSNIIIVNTSTVPLNFSDGGMTSYYGQLNFTMGPQSFSAEYKKIGSSYQSLGNPFLKNNYEGYSVSERFWVWQRKIIGSVSYQQFLNNLSSTQISSIQTKVITANININIDPNIPQVFCMFSNQVRQSINQVDSFADYLKINDNLRNISVGTNYTRDFWGMTHTIRIMYTTSNRDDLIRSDVGTLFNSLTAGITEIFLKKCTLGIQYGRTNVTDVTGLLINNINTFSGQFQYDFIPKKVGAIAMYTNSTADATLYTPSSLRLSIIGKVYYKFYKGMTISADYGYQPYTEFGPYDHNYNDQYVYVKYSYDLNAKQ